MSEDSGSPDSRGQDGLLTYSILLAISAGLSALLFWGPGILPDVGRQAIYFAVPALAVVSAVGVILLLARKL